MSPGESQVRTARAAGGAKLRAAPPDAARSAALCLLHQLETSDQLLEPLLAQLDSSLADPRDRRFARQLILGCLRWRKRLDWIAGQFTRPSGAPLSPWVCLLLRLGLYQLFWLDRVPRHAAVHAAVELAKYFAPRGAASLVNAVLRRALREAALIRYPCPQQEPVAYLAIFHSHPEWLVARWLERWGGARTLALLQANNLQAPLYIRLNSLQTDPGSQMAILQAEGLSLRPAGPLPGYCEVTDSDGLFQSPAYAAGRFLVQDINAGLPVALLAPRPGESVLDLCSAPGGKAAQLAMEMGGGGLVLAADISPQRLLRVRDNIQRLGLRRVCPVVQDARCPALPPRSFAGLLVDAPCSATGILGRHPDARWRKTPAQLPGLVRRQEEILAQAFSLLSPGGRLVYSTCSLEEEENSGVVEHFLQRTPGAELEPADRFFPACPWADRYLQTLPGRDPGDGCFAARIRRRPS